MRLKVDDLSRYKAAGLTPTSGAAWRAECAGDALAGPLEGGPLLALLKAAGKWVVKHPIAAVAASKAAGDIAGRLDSHAATAKLESGDAESSGRGSHDTDGSMALRQLIGDDAYSGIGTASELHPTIGDVFSLNPAMIAAAVTLGKKISQRPQMQTLAQFLMGDPLVALAKPCPLVTTLEDGSYADRDALVDNLLAGGILDSLKSLAQKAAPAIAKGAGVVEKIASFIPGGIGTAISTVAGTVKNVADKASGIASMLPGGESEAPKITEAPAATATISAPAKPVARGTSITGGETKIIDSRARELASMAQEVTPPALYGDPTSWSEEDKAAGREVVAAVTAPGVVIADQYQVPRDESSLSGDAKDVISGLWDKAKGLFSKGSDTASADLSGVTTSATEASGADDGAPTSGDDSAPVRSSDLVEAGPGGEVVVSPEAQATAEAIIGDVPNGDPIYDRAFSVVKRLDAMSARGELGSLGAITLPEDFAGSSKAADYGGEDYQIPQAVNNAICSWAVQRWISNPKLGVTPALTSALTGLVTSALVRDAQSEDGQRRAKALAEALLQVAALDQEDFSNAHRILDSQLSGTASPEEGRWLSDILSRAALNGEALVDAFSVAPKRGLKGWISLGKELVLKNQGLPTKELSRMKLNPAVKLILAEAADMLSGIVSDAQMQSNGGILRDLLKGYGKTSDSRERLKVDPDEVAAVRSAASAPTDEGGDVIAPTEDEEAIWAANKSWLQRAGKLMSARSLTNVLTALGFTASVASLLITALKHDHEADRAAEEANASGSGATNVLPSKTWKRVGVVKGGA